MKHHLRKDWLKWVAACFALVATASAEYELARAIGMDQWVAVAVPGALDAYVLRALRAHREVLTAVLAMVGVNAASHLLTAGHLYLDWPLITAVSAIAPLVLWRVHALGTPGEARQRALWGASTAEPDEHGRTEEEDERAYEHPGPYEPDEHASTDTFEEHASTAVGVLDYVPREWSTPPVPEHAPDDSLILCACEHETLSTLVRCLVCEHRPHRAGTCPAYVTRDRWEIKAEPVPGGGGAFTSPCSVCSEPVTFTDEHGWEHAPGSMCVLTEHGEQAAVTGTLRILKAVPDLPDGYKHAGLKPGDDAYLNQARVLHARGTALRNWKTVLGVGTARAQRLRDHIENEHSASTEESE